MADTCGAEAAALLGESPRVLESDDHDRDYVLGTHDDEITRLGLQHEAWRPTVRECWRRGGVTEGSRVIDVGAGPGYAALDLARIVGPAGSVIGVERSSRFVEFARAEARRRGVTNVGFLEQDLMTDAVPEAEFDVAWCRWVGSFVESPSRLTRAIARAVRPGGTAIFHEYVDYAAWRYSPTLPLVEQFVSNVMDSWRSAGGEPDIAMSLPPLLRENGFVVREAVPRVFCVGPGDKLWDWIATFVRVNSGRLVQLDRCDAEWTRALHAELDAAEADPNTLMLTPMILEIIAERVG